MSNLNKRSKPSRFRKKHTSLNKPKVLSMFVAMEQRAAQDAEDFFTSGRTGRRNAMADILGVHATTTTADMADKLQALTTNPSQEKTNDEPMSTASSSYSVDSSSSISAASSVDISLKENPKIKKNQVKSPEAEPDQTQDSNGGM